MTIILVLVLVLLVGFLVFKKKAERKADGARAERKPKKNKPAKNNPTEATPATAKKEKQSVRTPTGGGRMGSVL